MPDIVERLAKAKVNLALHVLGRRGDGYHELDTLAVFTGVADRVGVSPASELTLSVSGPFASHAPVGAGNLVLKAAEALRRETGFRGGAAIRLEKNIPAGAGFGGGSADAAAALHALNALWALGLGSNELLALGPALGADVAMCLVSRALRARGTGERIEPVVSWPNLPLVLAWPGVHVATASVFAALERRENPPLPEARPAATPAELAAWLAACRNDLEEPAIRLAPQIGELLQGLRATPGCLLARMSGSGSGCFAIYADSEEAEVAAAALSRAEPSWWLKAAIAR